MGPKKGGKKAESKPAINEVDKTFYEIKLANANNRVATLRTEYTVLENRLADVTSELRRLDIDRAEVISYLERTLDQRTKEIAALQARILEMERDRDSEIQVYKDQVEEVQREYRVMRQDLSSQMKLLVGKLNALEEFRAQQNALMAKFDKQEKEMAEQEERHKRLLYEAERKFIISKDTLKKEMENRLLQLSNDFQKVTEMRIATTTHRVIHENIALNNEFELMQETIQRLERENETFKKRDKELTIQLSISEETKDKTIARSSVQESLLQKLSLNRRILMETILNYTHLDKVVIQKDTLINQKDKLLKDLTKRVARASQDIHMVKCHKRNVDTTLQNTILENNRLEDIIYNAVMTIQEFLKKPIITHPRKKLSIINNILQRLEDEHPAIAASMATVSLQSTPPAEERSVIEIPPVKPMKYIRNRKNKTSSVTSSLRKMPAFIRTREGEEEIEEEEEEEIEEELEMYEESSSESILSVVTQEITEFLGIEGQEGGVEEITDESLTEGVLEMETEMEHEEEEDVRPEG